MRCSTLALLALLGLSAVALAQADKKDKKPPPNPNEVEVRLNDGSRVRMIIQQESLEIVTRFGKLTVPTAEIRRIEFGVRPTEDVARKIDDAIRRLGHENFKERENAANELVALGSKAYVSLVKATRSKDLEVAQRAKAALVRVRQKLPETQLRLKEDDTIQTNDFTIAGRISTQTIKATTAVFGETTLKVSDLRGIRWMGLQAEVDLNIDASKYAIAPAQWLDTGVDISLDDDLSVTASGQIDLMTDGSGQNVTGPTGSNQWGQGPGRHPPGCLLGRIGETGETFVVGESFKTPASKKEGRLYLSIAPSPWRGGGNGPSGSFKISIHGGRDTLDRDH